MGHYFENQENLASKHRRFDISVGGKKLKFITDLGVFSRTHLDDASELLLKTLVEKEALTQALFSYLGQDILDEKQLSAKHLKALDLGCGYGPLTLFFKAFFPYFEVEGVEVNERAFHLAKENARQNHLDLRFVLEDARTYLQAETYDVIFSNPPIRVGKKILYELIAKAYEALKPGASLFLVIGKKQGADSMEKYLKTFEGKVECLAKDRGFKIFALCKSTEKA